MNNELLSFVEAKAKEFRIPGVAVGIYNDGKEHYTCFGVTSIDNPLPITPQTLFVLGSITKTYTATAIMRLVVDGRLMLDTPVQHYIPEFRLKDNAVAADITIRQLLNHTSGLDWGITIDTGEGDDALKNYVSMLPALPLLSRPGHRFSYSQAGYNVLGRVIEKITGHTYEKVINEMLLSPLGLCNTFFDRDDIMTRRFCVGHNRDKNSHLEIARLWRRWRGENPGGGLASSVEDQIRWARFHLGNKKYEKEEEKLLSEDGLHQMQVATTALRASNLGDGVGLCWFLRKINGILTVGHAGSANGQFGELIFVPEYNFAVVSLANAGPDGLLFNQAILKWALQNYIGLEEKDMIPKPFDAGLATEITGRYENEVMTLDVYTEQENFKLKVLMKKEIRAAANKELPPDHEPFYFSMLPEREDEYIITSGAFKGQRGYFTRDKNKVVGIDLAGRLFSKYVNK